LVQPRMPGRCWKASRARIGAAEARHVWGTHCQQTCQGCSSPGTS